MKRRELKLYLIIFCCLSCLFVLILIIQESIQKERKQHYSYMMSVNNYVNQCHHKSRDSNSIKLSYDKSFDQQKFTSFLKEINSNQVPSVSYSQAISRSSQTTLLTFSTHSLNLNYLSSPIVEHSIASTQTQFEPIRTHNTSVFRLNNDGPKMQLDHSQKVTPNRFTLPGEEIGDGPDSPDMSAPLKGYFLFFLLLSSFYLMSLKYRNS